MVKYGTEGISPHRILKNHSFGMVSESAFFKWEVMYDILKNINKNILLLTPFSKFIYVLK